MRLRDRLGVSTRRQEQLTRAMQAVLVGLLAVGLWRRDAGVLVNAGLSLAVTELPAVLERDYQVSLDAGLTLWIVTAVFLHAIGTVELTRGGCNFYQCVGWYDHVTHALSASVVAAAGYTSVRALDEHSDAVSFPSKFVAVFVVLFVLAFGVLWEVIEFATGFVADALGQEILVQYGLEDTLLDLVFDAVGAVVVAVWGAAHLSDVVGMLARRLDAGRR